MPTDLYEVLGVSADASQAEIDRAWRQAVRAVHPDRNPGDPEAARRARRVLTAGRVLRDPDRRQRFDQARKQRAQDGFCQRLRCPTWESLGWTGGGSRRLRLFGGSVTIVHKG